MQIYGIFNLVWNKVVTTKNFHKGILVGSPVRSLTLLKIRWLCYLFWWGQSELLSKFFTSVFTREDTNSIPSIHLSRDVPIVDSVTMSPTIVHNKLCTLKPNKSPEPEGWPVLALKKWLRNYLFHSLYHSTNHLGSPQFLIHGKKLLLLPSKERRPF